MITILLEEIRGVYLFDIWDNVFGGWRRALHCIQTRHLAFIAPMSPPRAAQEIAVIAKEPGCLQAIVAVLRSGPGSCTQACQHLSAALLWSTAANPGCVGQLAGCTGLVSTFLTVFNPEIDSGIQVGSLLSS
jgi:hypothetical protein